MKKNLYLALNSGSSSIKLKLFEKNNEDWNVICDVLLERIGIDNGRLILKDKNNKKIIINKDIKNHEIGIKLIFDTLINEKIIFDFNDFKVISHRVVHGGRKYREPILVTEKIISDLEQMIDLSPLHIPGHLIVIKTIRNLINTPNIIVFDTNFHKTIPQINHIFALPWKWYEEYGIQKYGFHGSSYEYIVGRLNEISHKKTNSIICHLGNGSSISVIKNDECLDTSMGFTKLNGLMMGTRCGNIDPSIPQYMSKKLNISIDKLTEILWKESGFLAVSGISSDGRDIENAAASGNKRAQLSLDLYSQKCANYIVEFANKLKNKVDYIVFTAGIGENSKLIVSSILSRINLLNIKLKINIFEKEEEKKIKGFFSLTTSESKINVLIMKTNEELVLVKTAEKILNQK